MNLFVKAIGSFYFEHGVYAKPSVMEKLELQVGDPVILIPMDTRNRHVFVDCIFSFDEIDLLNEAVMLLSMFDALACHHYYFLCEFGFTEKVGWTPKQYDYLYEIEPFNIGKEKYERQVFLNLYTKVEEKWLDFTMSLRNEQVEPSLVFLEAKDTEIRKKIEAALINNANLFVVGSLLCSNTYFQYKNEFYPLTFLFPLKNKLQYFSKTLRKARNFLATSSKQYKLIFHA
jgi:hypothetical protein